MPARMYPPIAATLYDSRSVGAAVAGLGGERHSAPIPPRCNCEGMWRAATVRQCCIIVMFGRIEQQSDRLLSAFIRHRPAKHRPSARRGKPDIAAPVRSARAAAAMLAAGLCRSQAAWQWRSE
jgi:hypothetical protein